jgi:hypothetical protein
LSHLRVHRVLIAMVNELELMSVWNHNPTDSDLDCVEYNWKNIKNCNSYCFSLSLFFPSFVRLIDVFNTLLVFSTLLSLL